MNLERLELLVGSFVFSALVILFVLIFSISGTYALRPGYYSIQANFSNAGGLRKGSPVQLSGRPVGEVGKFEMIRDAQTGVDDVLVTMYIRKKIQIREQAVARIYGTTFALSEPFVEIRQGGNEDGDFVEPGDIIQGIPAANLDDLVKDAEVALVHARSIFEQVDKAISDPEISKAFRDTLYNVRNVSYSLNEVLGHKDSDINQSIDDLSASLEKMRIVFDRVEKGEGTLGKLTASDELYTELMDFVKDLKAHPWKLLHKEKDKKFILF